MKTPDFKTTEQLEFAQKIASGDVNARKKINNIIDPIINYQTGRFCKRYCFDNKYRFKCTLIKSNYPAPKNSALCEWGNASYGWMLNDLTGQNRFLSFKAKNGSSLKNYLYIIANSISFYERWKNWRFGTAVYVPTYIQELHPDAKYIFYGLLAHENCKLIAQKLGRNEKEILKLSREIIVILTKKKRLHLLDPPATISVTDLDSSSEYNEDGVETDIPSFDEAPEQTEDKLKLARVWTQLTTVEQFVLEAMYIEEQDAEDVLCALAKLNISIKKGIAADQTNRQQLYYFRRKSLAKLSELMRNEK